MRKDEEGISKLEMKELNYLFKSIELFIRIKNSKKKGQKTKLVKPSKTRQLIIFPFKELEID